MRSSIDADRQFVWGLRYIDDLVLRDRDADATSGTGNYGKTGSGLKERLYGLQDPNWNVVALANTRGTIQERYIYEAYGQPTILDADFSADADGQSDFAWEYLYTGRRLDEEAGLYHYRHRDYHAPLGRFLTRDPIRFEGGNANLYRYVENNPVCVRDPGGLAAVKHVPGPGKFTLVTLDVHKRQNKLEAAMYLKWTARPMKFVRRGNRACKKCSLVGFAQIYRESLDYVGYLSLGPTILRPAQTSWKVDKRIPYPHGVSARSPATADPTKSPFRIGMRDWPYVAAQGTGWRTGHYKFEAETCVICLKGPEGIVIDRKEYPRASLSDLSSITTYGCVKWGFAYELQDHGRWSAASYSLSVPHQDMTPGPNVAAWGATPVAGAPP